MTEEEARQIISPLGGSGGSGDGFLPSYIVGDTPYADDWLSDEVSGDPITPEEGLLYLILTHGDYYSGFYRYLESESAYVLVGNARIRELTKAEYFALTEEEQNDGTVYFITDEGGPQPIDVPDRGFTPVGTIISVMGKTAPNNYLACDGATYNIADYQELAAYFADQFGSTNYFGGDGTTTFAVPDLRGEFLRGTGTNSHANQGSGEDVGEHQDSTTVPVINGAADVLRYFTDQSRLDGGSILFKDYDSIVNQSELDYLYDFRPDATSRAGSVKTVGYTIKPTNTSVLYCIAYKSTCITVETIDERNVYSTDEKIIGQWLDGKPIYQKIVDCGALPNNSSKSVQHGITNLDKCVYYTGISIGPITCKMPYIPTSSSGIIALWITNTSVEIATNSDRSTYAAYVTLQYTKTTD